MVRPKHPNKIKVKPALAGPLPSATSGLIAEADATRPGRQFRT